MKVGIVGCGAIGSYLAGAIKKKYSGRIRLVGVCERDSGKVAALNARIKGRLRNMVLSNLVRQSDLVIEAAGVPAARETINQCLRDRTDVMLMSVGALIAEPAMIDRALRRKVRLYVPSGAVAGLDALKAARQGKISSVRLTTRKPLAGLRGAAYIERKGIDLEAIQDEAVIFEGTARQAVAGFPKNINVAAVLSLAGIGPAKTRVRIIASRRVRRNTHTIAITGDFGTIECCTENVPSAANPKTSTLAMLSALAMLERLLSPVQIGS